MSVSASNDSGLGKLTDLQRAALLDLADRAGSETDRRRGKVNRDASRLSYRRPSTKCRMSHPGGGVTEAVVITRNLSATGISFIYSGFVHVGTNVQISLQRRRAGEELVEGVVRHCRHLSSQYHVVGVQFKTRIFPGLFLDESSLAELLDEVEVKPADLTGRVLAIDAEPANIDLLKFRLKETKIELSVANTGEAAIAKVVEMKSTPFDVVIAELDLPDMTGADLLSALRSEEYKGPILVLTSETIPARLRDIMNVATAVLSKPYTAADLHKRLGNWLQTTGTSEQPIFSELKDAEMTTLITGYVESAHKQVVALKTAMDANDFPKVRSICLYLKGSGEGFGFGLLSTVAREALTALDASMSVSETARELRSLQSVARRLRTAA